VYPQRVSLYLPTPPIQPRYPHIQFILPTLILKHPVCLNRRTIQVSQTRRWVFPNDYTDGDTTAPKLDGVTKHFQQDEGEVPSHDMTIIQSVSYRDRSLSRERTHMDLETPVV
jgi:hypothetical protein